MARATAVRGAELGPPLGAPAAGESAHGPPGGTWDLDLQGFTGAGGLSPGGKIISQDVEEVSLPTALLCEARIDVSVGRLFGGCRGPLLGEIGSQIRSLCTAIGIGTGACDSEGPASIFRTDG